MLPSVPEELTAPHILQSGSTLHLDPNSAPGPGGHILSLRGSLRAAGVVKRVLSAFYWGFVSPSGSRAFPKAIQGVRGAGLGGFSGGPAQVQPWNVQVDVPRKQAGRLSAPQCFWECLEPHLLRAEKRGSTCGDMCLSLEGQV